MVSYEGDRGAGGGFPWGLRSEERGRKGVVQGELDIYDGIETLHRDKKRAM